MAKISLIFFVFSIFMVQVCLSAEIPNRSGKTNLSFDFDGFYINKFLSQIGGKYWLTENYAFVGGIDYGDRKQEDEYNKYTSSHLEELIGFEFHEIVHPEVSLFYGVQIGIGNKTTFTSNKKRTITYNTEESKKNSWQFFTFLIGTEYFLAKAVSLSAFYGITSWTETYKVQDKLDATNSENYSYENNGSITQMYTSPSKLILSIYF
jgi:hypothetical protein